jgi:phospholipid/cholesterol/gamma-HCH transport system substrate-binding protein
MRRVIREHLKDFIAVVGLFIAGLAVTGYILSQQQQPYPSWVPFLGDEVFELKAELSTAQAVTPGQGQTVNISGVKAGDISKVELEDGKAVVTMLIEPDQAELINTDATVLLRPRTGLQDMTMELDPGTNGEPIEEGSTISLSQTKPNVNPDQILASLDGDTRDYLQLLLAAGGEGLGGRGKELSAALRRFEPFGRDLAAINGLLAERRQSIRQSITSFRLLSDALARSDTRLAEWVTAQSQALEGFANQSDALRESLQEFPSTLTATQEGLESSNRLAVVLGPAATDLIPTAQTFAPAQVALQSFLRATVDPLETQIRPFTRQVQTPVRHLQQASGPLAKTANQSASAFGDLNRFFNAWAYNPPGSEEGYLFWTAWLNHNANVAAQLQDANGPLPRGVVLQSCATARLAESLAVARPFIRTLQQYTNAPQSEIICPLDPSDTGGGIFGREIQEQVDEAAANLGEGYVPEESDGD